MFNRSESEPFKMMSRYAFGMLLIVLAPDIISLYGGYGTNETSILAPERIPGLFAIAVSGLVLLLFAISRSALVRVLGPLAVLLWIGGGVCGYIVFVARIYDGPRMAILLVFEMVGLFILGIHLLRFRSELRGGFSD